MIKKNRPEPSAIRLLERPQSDSALVCKLDPSLPLETLKHHGEWRCVRAMVDGREYFGWIEVGEDA
ncbi:hypothetical protein AGMMS49992_29750 [Clostridia bacterium]|nr:hypothetical protein AGMMS49992_29750 [Clostridia bacterium]